MISEIELTNFGPFRGKHHLRFSHGAYAVIARDERDPKSSNGIGKSMLLEAIRFAIDGKVSKLRRFDADGWITRGEKSGGVILRLERSEIERTKKRGQSQQIRFRTQGIGEAAQDAAQEAIERFLCFGSEDYRHAVYIEQREAAQLIHTDPGDRLGIISGWLGLTKVEKAEAIAASFKRERWSLSKILRAKREGLAVIAGPEFDPDAAEEEIVGLKGIIAKMTKQLDEVHSVERLRGVIAEHEKKIERGKYLRKLVDDTDGVFGVNEAASQAEEEIERLSNLFSEQAKETARRRRVALGKFDGRCPVAPIECPARKHINQLRGETSEALKEAEKALAQTEHNLGVARKSGSEIVRKRLEHEVNVRELTALRADVLARTSIIKEAREAVTAAKAHGDSHVLENNHLEASEQLSELQFALRSHRENEKRREEHRAAITKITEELTEAERDHEIARKARDVFRSARRRVAERAIKQVEENANDAIASAGVDLTITIRWEKEGKDPASECDECGAPFPASARVKLCEGCAAPRGYNIIRRLDFILSESSGALDDLGGIAVQLSAGAWFLAHRQSPWSTAILDEPTAQMDLPFRRGLVRYLSALTHRGTYRQLFLISHSSDTVEALPHRITIVRTKNGERRIEVS